MSLKQKGLFEEFVPRVSSPKTFTYALYGVDVYRSPDCAIEDNVYIDLTRPCDVNKRLFFSGRFLTVLNCQEPDEECFFSSVQELKSEFNNIKFGYLCNRTVIQTGDTDIAYIASPLTETEINDLGDYAGVPLDAGCLEELLIIEKTQNL